MTLKTRQALREVTKQLVVIHGESGTGKTFVAIDMAFSFMYGQPFLSHFKPSEPSRVVYVSHDNVSGLKGGVVTELIIEGFDFTMTSSNPECVVLR